MHRGTPRSSYDGGKIAGLYDLEETLGRGHFAVVKSARHVFTGEKVAVKVIDKTKLDNVSRAHLFQEVRCMKLVQHPNVVRLYEVIDTHSKLYLILELADGGDLYDYIMRHELGLSEKLAQEYFAQIVRAISYCHRLHVVHRDLKPENVVFFERLGVVKLTDFGFSNKFCPGQKLETSCGSLAYSAPEILLGDSYDAPAVDIWSLGVILYMLVCGQAPFQEANDSETLTMIMDCKYTIPAHISEDCRRLIARMLVRQPEKRATLEEITSDCWLKDSQSDISLPLISRTNISDENHSMIVQRMVGGGIATKEQILEALEKNSYNYITATYYLLAERKLRSLGPKESNDKQIPKLKIETCSEEETSSQAAVNNCNKNIFPATKGGAVLDIVQRTRKCSIVTEEEDEDEDNGKSDDSHSSSLNRRGSRSEGKLSLAVEELRKEALIINVISESNTAPSPLTGNSSARGNNMLPPPLISARSSPQLGLDEISEDGGNARSTCSTPRNFVSFENRRSKFKKSRTASCSSSEASDEDSEGRKKRGSTNPLFRNNMDRKDKKGDGGSSGGNMPQGGSEPSSGSKDGPGAPLSDNDSNNAEGRYGSSNIGNRNCLTGRHKRRSSARLRESQSLDRITEVQESDILMCSANTVPVESQGNMKGVKEVITEKLLNSKKDKSKRNAFFNKYLNLQRKFCIPLLKRGRGRLYKTQSYSEINNKDINENFKSTVLSTRNIGMSIIDGVKN